MKRNILETLKRVTKEQCYAIYYWKSTILFLSKGVIKTNSVCLRPSLQISFFYICRNLTRKCYTTVQPLGVTGNRNKNCIQFQVHYCLFKPYTCTSQARTNWENLLLLSFYFQLLYCGNIRSLRIKVYTVVWQRGMRILYILL